MDKNIVIKEIDDVKIEIRKLMDRLDKLEKQINVELVESTNDTVDFSNVIPDPNLFLEFQKYLVKVKNLKEVSIKDYLGELRKIRVKFFEFLGINIPYEIYEIGDLKIIHQLQQLFKNNGDFIQTNIKSHYSLSAAINNYTSFLEYNCTDFILDED